MENLKLIENEDVPTVCDLSSDDDKPLIMYKEEHNKPEISTRGHDIFCNDIDEDILIQCGICEVKCCDKDVFAACDCCNILVCYDHLMYTGDTCGHILKSNTEIKNAFSNQNHVKECTYETKSPLIVSPVKNVKSSLPKENKRMFDDISDVSSNFEYDSDADPSFDLGNCEVKTCKEKVHGVCEICEIHVCKVHLKWNKTDCEHNKKRYKKRKIK